MSKREKIVGAFIYSTVIGVGYYGIMLGAAVVMAGHKCLNDLKNK